LLARALASVLDQEGVTLEVVVVDEGSTDETPARLAALTDERVRTLRNDSPTGVANARNRGISAARGEWVAFLDDDDFWAPTKIRAQLDGCAAAGADFSYTGLVTTDPPLETRRVSAPAPTQGLERALLGMNVIGAPSSVMVRRSLLERVGGFDPGFSVLADWDLYIRLAADGRPSACEAPLTAYLTHPTNMHLDAPAAMEEFGRLRSKHAALAKSLGVKLGDDRWWGWIAGSLRRSGHRFKGAALFLWLGLRFARPHLIARAAGMLAGDRLSDRARSLRPAAGAATGGSTVEASWIDAFEEPRPETT
jgi:glycosyltransferase involved in cell wall biosynthesis